MCVVIMADHLLHRLDLLLVERTLDRQLCANSGRACRVPFIKKWMPRNDCSIRDEG
jgi:hypothetical protein